MKQPEDLLLLIRSLTPNEKRYFKLHSKSQVSAREKKTYEKLFDALNYWDGDYDETIFRRKHKDKAFVKNLPKHKERLYDLLLKVCLQFSETQSTQQQFYAALNKIDYLHSKRLKTQAEDMLTKLSEVSAIKAPVWKLLIHESKYQYSENIRISTMSVIETIKEKTDELAAEYIRFVQLRYMSDKMTFYSSKKQLSRSEKREFDALGAETRHFFQLDDNFIPSHTHYALLFSLIQYLKLNNQNEEALELCLKIIKQEEASGRQHFYPTSFHSLLTHTLWILDDLPAHIDLYPELIAKLKGVKFTGQKTNMEAISFVYEHSYELLFLMKKKNYKACDKVVEHFYENYHRHEAYIRRANELEWLLLRAHLEIKKEEFGQAIQHVEHLMKLIPQKQFYTLEFSARVIRFMSLAMLDNYNQVGNEYRSLQRFVKQHEVEGEFYVTMLKLCKAIVKTGSVNSPQVRLATHQLQDIPCVGTNLKDIVNFCLNKSEDMSRF